MTGERLDELRLSLMESPAEHTARFHAACTVSVKARHGATTGISAFDRTTAIRALIDPANRPDDLTLPRRVFPLQAATSGLVTRPGQTDASLDLTRLVGLCPATVLCEMMSADGSRWRTCPNGNLLPRCAV